MELQAENPAYAWVERKGGALVAATRFADGIVAGTANHDGDAVKRACKTLGIKPTRTAIRAFIGGL